MRGLPEVLCTLVKPGPQDRGDGTEKEKGTVTSPTFGLWGLRTGPGYCGLTQKHPMGLGVNREFIGNVNEVKALKNKPVPFLLF